MGSPRLGLFVVVATCRRAAASNASEVATLGTWWQNVDATTDGSLNASFSSWWQGDFMASVVDWLNATNGQRPSLAYVEDEAAYRRWYEHERCAFALPWDESGASFVSSHELETEILGDNTATTYIAPSQARKAMINQKYEHGGDDVEIDHATVAFTFAEFLHYVVHYDENPTTFNGRRSWAEHFNPSFHPPSKNCDGLFRLLFPPVLTLLFITTLGRCHWDSR